VLVGIEGRAVFAFDGAGAGGGGQDGPRGKGGNGRLTAPRLP
jgi:hypothetical protein